MAEMSDEPGAGRRLRRGEKVYVSVARDIVRRIRSERLQPGARLPSEAQMLAEYGVGRGSLREALRVLEVNGLISVKAGPGGGPVVAGVDSHAFGSMATLYFQVGGMTFGELVEARLVMEPVMARLAAERRDPELIAELGRALSEAEAADLGDGAEYLSVSIDFHEIVAGMSGNRILNLYGIALLESSTTGSATGCCSPVSRRRASATCTRRSHERSSRETARGPRR